MSRKLRRREFMAVVAGAGAALIASSGAAGQPASRVPRRAFGRTGATVSGLCLGGGSFLGAADSTALLDGALRHGVDTWEIVSFTGKTYGDYFDAHPGIREKLFLSGKVRSTDPAVMQEQLDKLLLDNRTSFLDFLAIHTVDDPARLTVDVRKWVDGARKEGKIRFFGVCVHKNMDACLTALADLDWIDGIQTVYNYRIQSAGSMENALQKCHEKGIGIFAIKSMGLTVQPKAEQTQPPLPRLSFEQARLKAIWRNPNVSSICSMMPNLTVLQENAGAAMDPGPLSADAAQTLSEHAGATAKHYCRRCGTCDRQNADQVPIFDIMEALMYTRGYGLKELGAAQFARIPAEIRGKIRGSDYAAAEERCPQGMPIARLMNEALIELGG